MRKPPINVVSSIFHLNWGDIPTWTLALLSLLGLLAAYLAGRVAVKASRYAKGLLEVELKREKIRDLDVEKFQSSKVSAWTEVLREVSATGIESFSLVAVANNGSDLPIFDVTCTWSVKDLNNSNRQSLQNLETGLIPPNSRSSFHLSQEKFLDNLHPEVDKVANLANALEIIKRSRVSVIFTDAEHKSWIRRADGKLIDVPISDSND